MLSRIHHLFRFELLRRKDDEALRRKGGDDSALSKYMLRRNHIGGVTPQAILLKNYASRNLYQSLLSKKCQSKRESRVECRCIPLNNNNIENVKEGLMDLMSGMVEEMLKTEDADTILSEIMGGVAVDEESRALFDQILERIGVKKEGVVKSGNNDGKIRKMKCCVNELQMKDAQLEKCQKELAEARALVEEVKGSIEIVIGDESSMIAETKSGGMSNLKAVGIFALIDILVKVSAKVLVGEVKHCLVTVFEDKDSLNAETKSQGMSRNEKRLKSLKSAAISAFVDTLVNVSYK
ncbi:hypothetical protein Tco_1191066 [Tanacetum coccineum]